jgi:hypothetical protein
VTPRPILMPGGWPSANCDRIASERLLEACCGDLDRVFDETHWDPEAYIRKIKRIPCYKFAGEQPIFFVTGRIRYPSELMVLMSRIFDATDVLNHASWLNYLPDKAVDEYLEQAALCADIDEAYDSIYYWYTEPRPTLIVTETSRTDLVGRALMLLEATPDSTLVTGDPGADSYPALQAQQSQRPEPSTVAGSVVGLESLARMRAASAPSSEHDTADLKLGGFCPVRPNPRIRRNAG